MCPRQCHLWAPGPAAPQPGPGGVLPSLQDRPVQLAGRLGVRAQEILYSQEEGGEKVQLVSNLELNSY